LSLAFNILKPGFFLFVPRFTGSKGKGKMGMRAVGVCGRPLEFQAYN
jgi:hypothetical protein